MDRCALCVYMSLLAAYAVQALPIECIDIISSPSERSAGGYAHSGPATDATSISLSCEIGQLLWPNASSGRSHVVQFHKNHKSFTLCFSGHGPSSKANIYQLKGQSRMLIKKAEREGDDVCVQSQCNYVSLLFEVGGQQLQPETKNTAMGDKWTISPLEYTYSYTLDHRCPRCSDTCLQEETCHADYMLIGIVQSYVYNGNTRYVSRVKIERFIRYNGTYQSDDISTPPCKLEDQLTTSNSYGAHSFVPVQRKGIVTVHSHCLLRPHHRYLISADLNLRLKNKGRLNLACAQEDVGYAQFHLNKLLRKGVCCS